MDVDLEARITGPDDALSQVNIAAFVWFHSLVVCIDIK